MSIDVKKSEFGSNLSSLNQSQPEIEGEPTEHRAAGNPVLATILGAALGVGFYGLVYAAPWAPLKRYFLGHPVAVAATVLFGSRWRYLFPSGWLL